MVNYSAQKIIPLAVKAAQTAMKIRSDGQLVVTRKPDGSKVTNADLKADEIIRNGIRSFDAQTIIISEEDKQRHSRHGEYSSAWVMDPIDGTGSFIKGLSDWGVLVSYVEKGVPVEGVAYYPEKNLVYYTEGTRAFKRSLTTDAAGQIEMGPPQELKTRENVGSTLRYGQFISDISSRFPAGSQQTAYTQPSNSFAVIDGVIDVAVNPPTMGDWDLAAPDAILRKAGGGFVSSGSGELLKYGSHREEDRAFLQQESVAGNIDTLVRFGLADKELKASRSKFSG